MSIFSSIGKSIVEARFLKLTFKAIWSFIRKIPAIPSKIRTVIDWTLAIVPRLVMSYSSKVQPNKIIFMTFNHRYMCNPKYICEEINRQNLPVDMVWAVTTPQLKSQEFPKNVRLVVRGTYPFFKELVTSKVWVENAFGLTWNPIPKKKDQFYLQTWHGSMGLKRMGKEDVKNRRWSFAASLSGKWVDLCISNSTFETEIFRQTHWPTNQIQELGHARNDILFSDKETQDGIRSRICEYFEIDPAKKIALYAPTFRNSDSPKIFDLDYSRFLDALQKKFGGEWVLLNRYHFKTKAVRKKHVENTDERIISASSYPDIQELMVASDVGITDYSSWICDFVLTGRPGFIYAPDLAAYDQERGFYYPLNETPFPVAETNKELEENILNFDSEQYAKQKEEFLKARGCKETGTAAKQIVEIIKQQCGLS